MHRYKRLAGVLLALILTVSLLPSASARQFYSYLLNADAADEVTAMLDQISDQTFSVTDAASVRTYIEHFLYKSKFSALGGGRFPYTNAQGYWAGKTVSDGTYSQVVSATGCLAYCKFVSQVIYGTPGSRHDLEESAGKITADGLKAFLKQYAQAGEHIRVDGKHSVTFVSGTESGFYYLDYAGDQNPRIWLRYSTYGNFAAHCNELYKKVWLYEADPAVNVEKPAEPKTYEPAEWLSGYVSAAEELGLTQSGNTLDYNSSLTLAETVTLTARAHSLLTGGDAEFQAQDGEAWYVPYVNYLVERQIWTAELDLSVPVTRGQYVGQIFSAIPKDMELELVNEEVQFADASKIGDLTAATALYQAGILTGVQENGMVCFHPDDLITRGEAITLITRFVLPELRVSVN